MGLYPPGEQAFQHGQIFILGSMDQLAAVYGNDSRVCGGQKLGMLIIEL